MRYVMAFAVSSALAAGLGTARAETGVSPSAIVFGQAAVLQGPASALGLDAFGRAGLSGFEQAMKKRGLPILTEGTYERNTTAIEPALLALRKAAPEAVVMVGACQQSAAFIKLARKNEFNPAFVNIGAFDIGGLTMTFGPDDNEGLDKVFTTVIQPDGSFKAVDRLVRMSAS
jgi:ABC-type branched-subunit amino acid transport system substrate-binding protein